MGYGIYQFTLADGSEFDMLVQIEDKFSPFAKETLAKLITFLEVRTFPPNPD